MEFRDLYSRGGLIGAHRGHRALYPENTLSALEGSIDRCDFAEIDVQLSQDGIPIVIHDETLERTTNVAQFDAFEPRYPWPVETFTLAELQRLDYGSWFYAHDPFGTLADGKAKNPGEGYTEPLLTLEKALVFAKHHYLMLNIEIKRPEQSVFSAETVADRILTVIDAHASAPSVLISSYDMDVLANVRADAPKIATAALLDCPLDASLPARLKTLGVDACHIEEECCTLQTVKDLHRLGIRVGAFTVNEETRKKSLFAWRVDAIFTDFLENRAEIQ